MKHVKMLGLAAIAALALAAFGASTASAAELYSGATTLGKGTEISASLKAETSASLASTGGTTLDTCTASSVAGKTTSAGGGAGVNVVGEVTALSFSSCTEPVTVTSLGTLEINDSSELTGKGFHVDVNAFTSGTPCAYTAGEGTKLGTLTGTTDTSKHAVMDIDANVSKVTGGILCPSSARWIATYIVTSPTGLNVK